MCVCMYVFLYMYVDATGLSLSHLFKCSHTYTHTLKLIIFRQGGVEIHYLEAGGV
jgi:hypothetical protein